MALSRRDVLGFGIAASLIPLAQPALAKTFVNRTGLRSGQFVWEPSQPTSGPLVVIVSRAERLLHVYRNGQIVGISTCQTGSDWRTPMGVFLLNGQRAGAQTAAQPLAAGRTEMRELAWSGTALHAVNLKVRSPDCVRVPATFARLLSTITEPGALLIITDRHTMPNVAPYAGGPLRMPQPADHPSPSPGGKWAPIASKPAGADDAISIIMSRADRSALLLRNGVAETRARIQIRQPRTPLGTHVYSLLDIAPQTDSMRWLGFGLGRSNREPHIANWRGHAALDRITLENSDAASAMSQALHTGATLMLTDAPAGAIWRTQSSDVVVLAAQSSTGEGPRTAHDKRSTRRDTWANAPGGGPIR